MNCETSEPDCNDDSVCTLVLISVNIKVLNNDGTIVLLDRFQTEDAAGNVLFSGSGNNSSDYYTVLTDEEKELIRQEGSILTFRGWLGTQEVVNETFVIGGACCHIFKVSGPEEVRVN